jgi:plastocyanin
MTPRIPRPAAGVLLVAALLSDAAVAARVDVTVVARDGKPLADAAVFLEPREGRLPVKPAAGVEIGQVDKQFTSRVTVVPQGTEVSFPNRDKVRHHVYSFSPAKTFELKLYSGTPANPVLFDRTGIAVLGCNIHDQMIAWVVVVDTPHHGLSDAAGQVGLDGVAPGAYRLRTWHPALPPGAAALEQALVVPVSGSVLTVQLPVASGAAP